MSHIIQTSRSVCKARRLNKFWYDQRRLSLAASEFPTQHRAEYEIMKIALKTVKAKHSCNLSPVTDFVRQDVDNNLLRRCPQGPTDKLEILQDVPAWRRVAFGEVLESLPTALAKFKKGFEIIIRDRGGIGERLVREPFNVSLLSRKKCASPHRQQSDRRHEDPHQS